MTPQEFLRQVKREVRSHGFRVHMPRARWVQIHNLPKTRENRCSGYLDGDDRVLAVARGRDNWLDILAHEYCHFVQWRDHREWWDSFYVEPGVDVLEALMESFYGNRVLDAETQQAYAHKAAEIELDCEQRTLRLIQELNLPIDPLAYAKSANAYVAFYYAMPSVKGWCDIQAPYDVPEILALMPDHMDQVDYVQLARDHVSLFDTLVSR